MTNSLLTHVLDYFWDCCRTYQDHVEREPRPPEQEEGPRNEGDWIQYRRAYRPWEMNHHAHEDALATATRLLASSTFNDTEKAEIASRFAQLEVHHKNNEAIMKRITLVRERQGLAEAAVAQV